MKKADPTTILLWIVYLALLAVLLPHTAWAFNVFETPGIPGNIAAWGGAFAFEAALAVMTHKLSKHLEATPKKLTGWPRFAYRYLNAYAGGLLFAVLISALANLAHAVQFGQALAIFAQWGIPSAVYQIAFGGALPFVSLLFAQVLSNEVESDDAPNPELEAMRARLVEANKALKDAERQTKAAEQSRERAELQAQQAELKFAAAGELFVKLFAEEKRARVLAAKAQWPKLSAAAVAVITETSPSYVSEVLSEVES